MKNNLKLFFTSLINNNAVIDGARKKPWYAAIILFFVSILLSVIPSTVLELRKHGDKNFDSTTYMLREAVTDFGEELQNKKYDGKMVVIEEGKDKYLKADESVHFVNYYDSNKTIGYVFQYSEDAHLEDYVKQYQEANVSFVIFTKDSVYISILNPNNPNWSKPVIRMNCINAYKKLGENDLKSAYVPVIETGSQTETINQTWVNWKGLIRKLYNQTRLKAAGMQLAIISAVNAGISLIMGFMVWVLTRGKNNPYRLFSVWDSFKIAFWSGLSPAVLTCGLGFLITGFASTMFPLLLGVRVMWLSMKSLRPDGSGYAAD